MIRALIIIDMLKDFVDGSLANPKAQEIIPNIKTLLDHARGHGGEWIVVFSNDAHGPEDPELAVWGPHAMVGTEGAEVIDALKPQSHDVVSPKRTYGAFDMTNLDSILKSVGVDQVVLTGQHTHICVRHTAYGAMIRGYDVVVPRDAVCTFDGVSEDDALAYLEETYGADITTTARLLGTAVAA